VLRFIRDFLVPLPPLPEQVEIVDVVRKLMSLLDDLEAKLRKQEETATRLAESLAAAVAA
jgi:restriction endonuclease S subunit